MIEGMLLFFLDGIAIVVVTNRDVATEEYGYCDVYYFYKQFKALLGFAPSQCIPKSSG
jgi:hypothetical protein